MGFLVALLLPSVGSFADDGGSSSYLDTAAGVEIWTQPDDKMIYHSCEYRFDHSSGEDLLSGLSGTWREHGHRVTINQSVLGNPYGHKSGSYSIRVRNCCNIATEAATVGKATVSFAFETLEPRLQYQAWISVSDEISGSEEGRIRLSTSRNLATDTLTYQLQVDDWKKCNCSLLTTCSAIRNTSCGWCKSSQKALPGTKGGPSSGSCSKKDWIWTYDNC